VDLPDWNPLAVALLGLVVALADLTVRIAALGIIPANRKPSTGMAWLLAILLNPLLGLIAFAFFGRTRLGKTRHQRQREATARIAAVTQEIPPMQGEGDLPPYVASVARSTAGSEHCRCWRTTTSS
jgi:cardiolipin synthase